MGKIVNGLNEAAGREAERAAVVAWLRDREKGAADVMSGMATCGMGDSRECEDWGIRWAVYGDAADDIERGDHLPPPPQLEG